MTLDEAIKEFKGGSKLCKALGVARQNITYWRNKGFIPAKHQLTIQKMTSGKLRAKKSDTDYKI